MNVYYLFNKKVSVIKTHPSPWTLLLMTLSSLPPPTHKFLFLSTKSCDILCIFKQLIRVLLCFYSRDYEHCRRRRCRCRSRRRCLRKSFYQKRHFCFFCFVRINDGKTIQCVRHANAPLRHVCPIITREHKRRSWANFRGRRYITRKRAFLAYFLDLGLANDIYIFR